MIVLYPIIKALGGLCLSDWFHKYGNCGFWLAKIQLIINKSDHRAQMVLSGPWVSCFFILRFTVCPILIKNGTSINKNQTVSGILELYFYYILLKKVIERIWLYVKHVHASKWYNTIKLRNTIFPCLFCVTCINMIKGIFTLPMISAFISKNILTFISLSNCFRIIWLLWIPSVMYYKRLACFDDLCRFIKDTFRLANMLTIGMKV